MGFASQSRPVEAIPVLLYHSVSDVAPTGQELYTVTPAVFASHLAVLADSGRPIVALREIAEQALGGSTVPTGAVAISFDDGFADLATNALPRLLRHSMTATLFQTTGCIGGQFCDRAMLDESALRDLAEAGIDIGSHSVSHPHLDLLDPAARVEQLRASRSRLEEILSKPVDAIAYPHGSHHRRTARAAAHVGYRWAAAVKNAYSHAEDDPWGLARITITSDHTATDVARVLAGDGYPFGWRRERVRTTAFRQVRRIRTRRGHDRAHA